MAVLVILRLALPTLVENYVNNRLQELDGYTGSVADIDIALWRGAYEIEGLVIEKETGADADSRYEPFLSSEYIDLSLEWRSLFRGAIVGEVLFENLQVNIVEGEQTGEEVDWEQRLEELFPFRLNTVEIVNGTLSFRTPGLDTEAVLTAVNIDGYFHNLTNTAHLADEAFADFNFTASVLDAPLTIQGRADPQSPVPLFDVDLTMEQVQLPELNPWLNEYLKIDADAGTFELYLEIATADGQFTGYAKPILADANFFSLDDLSGNLLRDAWEAIVDIAAELFENQEESQVAARIPLSGTLDDPEIGTFRGLISILRNAFVAAFTNSLEGSVSLPDVGASGEEDDGS